MLLFIAISFFPMHRSSRDRSDQTVIVAQRKGDVEQPPELRSAQRMKPSLNAAMKDVPHDQQRLVEEYLLSLGLADPMLARVLTSDENIPGRIRPLSRR
jgi:hypothetical protein